ncbi:uncharacterized protein H6S33_011497 [Morchella sextelata]|uniref:uncharacterized protein n=1 Tax=Morchella sextelata TaxID=1174677 RepID=UPI001D05AE15|nr:uncharacterized protein H6S33_011497 [Morchella sextelata]KAH0611070.1 hypothetical protein H6S33_011497 [Morchella sextelata]
MPGILPMKLIKCGSSQTRIAQACDRCRSKKIRCDGIRPCCSQCANVGFECKTSDKLSRRAFPRGYTESLEERVRSLEQETRELKDLLDSKDEQLDMLSRIHSFSPYSPPASAASGVSHRNRGSPASARSESADVIVEDSFVAHENPTLVAGDEDATGGFYVGSSSGRSFIDLFKRKLQDSCADFRSDTFFRGQTLVKPSADAPLNRQPNSIKAPPRLLSDHLLVSYFQEYHPLFPVLHRPTFLASYEILVSGDGSTATSLPNHAIAQLFLVFAIALQQSEPRNGVEDQVNAQWQQALDAILLDSTTETLQCLVLAQLYCISKGDYARLLQYKSLAVGIVLRLGLNQSQKKFSLGALGGEMRKRMFCFSAAMLGLPKLLNEGDVDTEYPSDIDDEYVSEKGFLPTLPGDSTKISSALALFRSSRILARVLDAVYPTGGLKELTYTKLKELEDELDAWKSGLAPHLRLEFVNGTPATNVVHSRSPLLVLSYHYIRVLIHKPVVGSTLQQKSNASLHAIRESSKCIVQIVQLLTERKLGFSFCVNKAKILVLAGFILLYSSAECPQDSPLAKENQKLIIGMLKELENCSPTLYTELKPIAASIVKLETHTPRRPSVSPLSFRHDKPRESSVSPQSSPTEHLSVRRRFSSILPGMDGRKHKTPGAMRRASTSAQDVSSNMPYGHRLTSASLTDLLPRNRYSAAPSASPFDMSYNMENMWSNVDAANGSTSSLPQTSSSGRVSMSTNDWERLLATMDATHAAHIYGDGGGDMIPAGNMDHTAPPSTSSFSTLSEEGFQSDDGCGYPESEDLGDFLGPLMSTGGGGEWPM